jgi:rubredoxin
MTKYSRVCPECGFRFIVDDNYVKHAVCMNLGECGYLFIKEDGFDEL